MKWTELETGPSSIEPSWPWSNLGRSLDGGHSIPKDQGQKVRNFNGGWKH